MKKLYIYPFCFIILSFLILNDIQAQTTCPPIGNSKIENKDQVTLIEPNLATPGTGVECQSAVISDNRMIYWVHGMNGDEGSWSRASSATHLQVPGLDYPARQANKLEVAYTENQFSLHDAASHVDTKLQSDIGSHYEEDRSILIAHSQGGLVARYLDLFYTDGSLPRKVGGMAFFGTPHLGATGLEDAQNLAEQFMSKAASDLSAYTIVSLTSGNPNPIIRLVGDYLNIDSWVVGIVESVSTDVGGILFNSQVSGIVPEIIEESESLTLLNTATTDIPMIPYYGVFNEYETMVDGAPLRVETIWSTMQYLLTSPNFKPTFTATDFEFELQQTMNGVRSTYVAAAATEQAIADEISNTSCLGTAAGGAFFGGNPLFGGLIGAGIFGSIFLNECQQTQQSNIAAALQRRNAALRGARWFDTVNDQYKVVIGARESVVGCECRHDYYDLYSGRHEVWYSTQESVDGTGNDCDNYSGVYESSGEREEVNCYSASTGWVEHPSDGLVLASSAGGLPTHLIADQVTPIRMQGSTHFGMRNDDNLKNVLKALFNGEVDRFFKTDPK